MGRGAAVVGAVGGAGARAAVHGLRDRRRAGAGRRHVMADHVHPTAFGQIAIAERALAVLAADGLPPKVAPSSLISYETTVIGRARGAATYAYRRVKIEAKALVKQLAARVG